MTEAPILVRQLRGRADWYSDAQPGAVKTPQLLGEAADTIEMLATALRMCREHFTEIRMDWSDPRDEIRAGWAVIDEALAKLDRGQA
jgi:hypothetical protein